MDEKGLKFFSNDPITSLLHMTGNLPMLEDLINENLVLYSQLKKQKLRFGNTPAREELPKLLNEIKLQVDDFFGVSTISVPTIDYGLSGVTKILVGVYGLSTVSMLYTASSFPTNIEYNPYSFRSISTYICLGSWAVSSAITFTIF